MATPLRYVLLVAGMLYISFGSSAQSLRKEEAKAINRNQLRVVSGDTVQQFSITTRKRQHPRRRRTYHWYASNQVHRAQGEFNGQLLHGPYRSTTRQGQTLERGKFHFGTKVGRWRTWHPTGQLATESRWRHGNQRGPVVAYNEQGQRSSGTIPTKKAWLRSWLTSIKRRAAPRTTVAPSSNATVQVANSPTAPVSKRSQRKAKQLAKKARKQPVPTPQPAVVPAP